jgi:micrococcal nuclease
MVSRPTLILVLLLVFIASICYGKGNEYVVSKVLDGDTVVLENGDTVRYLGVAAPSLDKTRGGPDFYARESAKYNKKLVLLKKVTLEFDTRKKDEGGRLLAYVYVKNIFVNAELIRQGYARASIDPPNLKHKDLLLSYQQEAMAKDLGLWQEKKKETERYYVGNKKTYTFHKPSCPLALQIQEKGRIVFRNRADPIKVGYTPCKKCKP